MKAKNIVFLIFMSFPIFSNAAETDDKNNYDGDYTVTTVWSHYYLSCDGQVIETLQNVKLVTISQSIGMGCVIQFVHPKSVKLSGKTFHVIWFKERSIGAVKKYTIK